MFSLRISTSFVDILTRPCHICIEEIYACITFYCLRLATEIDHMIFQKLSPKKNSKGIRRANAAASKSVFKLRACTARAIAHHFPLITGKNKSLNRKSTTICSLIFSFLCVCVPQITFVILQFKIINVNYAK